MNFLQLVNAVREPLGASGAALTTLAGTLSQQNTRIKNSVNEAWRDIQRKHRTWGFMQREFSFQTTAGNNTYEAATLSTPITSFANWKRDSFRCYLTATGVSDEQILPYRKYPWFRDLYEFGVQPQQKPVLFAIDPLKKIRLGPTPDAIYTVRGQFYKAASDMVVDADEPENFDDEFHDLIVYRAMIKCGYFEAASEVIDRATREYDNLMTKLEKDYLPEIDFGPPLA